ncbi:MAG: DnaD domain protein [Clostridia bacterium]|nr:DnaD domain protein [Clostridia bacterium]
MADIYRKVSTDTLLSSAAYKEASADELRVLLYVLASPTASAPDISEALSLSPARCKSALALWEEERVIRTESIVKDEFKPTKTDTALGYSTLEIAELIRNRELGGFVNSALELFERASMSTGEIKRLIGILEDYDVSEFYVLTLMAYLKDVGRLKNVAGVVRNVKTLTEKNVISDEELTGYIEQKRRESEAALRMKRTLGIYDRPLGKSEIATFEKWVDTYGYSESIIGEAYDISVMRTGKRSVGFMDKILSRWYECGCKTLEECHRQNELDRETVEREKKEKAATRQKKTPKKESYGSFSAEDALEAALLRSYGDGAKKN